LNIEARFKKTITIASLLVIFCLSQAYAQEEIVITTYYPNPVGYYNTVKTQRMTVGHSRSPNNGLTYLIDDGVLLVDNQASAPLNPAEGQVYYNNTYHAFFYYTDAGLWFPLFINPRTFRFDPIPVVPYAGINPGANVTPCDLPFMHVINVLTLGSVPVSPALIADENNLITSGYMLCH